MCAPPPDDVASSAFELGTLLRGYRPEALMSLNDEGQQQSHHRGPNHDVSQRQGLYERSTVPMWWEMSEKACEAPEAPEQQSPA